MEPTICLRWTGKPLGSDSDDKRLGLDEVCWQERNYEVSSFVVQCIKYGELLLKASGIGFHYLCKK
jgi:hypothetical protein